MANTNAPRGLIPVRRTDGSPWTGGFTIYNVPASYGTAIYAGDPVIPTGTSDANGVPNVTLATAGATNYLVGAMIGIVSGGDPIIAVTRDMPVYRQASVQQYIAVADDPNLVFEIQEDGVGGALSVSDSMANADLVSGSGSTVTGYSGWMLDSSTAGTGATKQLRILRPVPIVDNTAGSTYAKWLVKINLHSLTNTTGI